MMIPFLVFWILILIGREELGFKGIFISVVIWLVLLLGVVFITGVSPYLFIAANALLDVVLILIVFGGDIDIPLRWGFVGWAGLLSMLLDS